MNIKMKLFAVIAAIGMIGLTACGPLAESKPSASQIQEQRTKQQALRAEREVPPPAINNFREKRTLHLILEMRDQGLTTFTYTTNLAGDLIHVCDSIGYPIPYATQSTNPERIWMESNYKGVGNSSYDDVGGTIPMEEPNGLFIPSSATATYAICASDEFEDGFYALYSEDNLNASPVPLYSTRSWQISQQ